MDDLNDLFSREEPNGRLVDLLKGFCGDECNQDEFFMMGTGEVIDFRAPMPLSPALTNSSASEHSSRSDSQMPMTFIGAIAYSLMATSMVMFFLATSFSSTKKQNVPSAAVRGKYRDEIPTSPIEKESRNEAVVSSQEISEEEEPQLKEEDDIPVSSQGSTPNKSVPNVDDFSKSKENPLPATTAEPKDVANTATESLGAMIQMSLREDAQSSALSLLSEDELKRHGGDMARSMSSIMSEFETIMKQQGYTVSQSESLAIASQRLASIEALQMARASEARRYLYDSQQRQVDRVLADQRHSEIMDAHDQEKDWFQKLQVARDRCVCAIQPAVQKSFVAVAIGNVVFLLFQYRHVFLSLGNSGLDRSFFDMICRSIDPLASLPSQRDETAYDMGAEYYTRIPFTSSNVVGWWLSSYQTVLLLFRIWGVLVMPLVGVTIFLVSNFFLPATVMQFAKSALMLWALVWAMSSIPWVHLCLGQAIFWALAHLSVQLMFDRARTELGRPNSICPTTKDLVQHLSLFDRAASSMTFNACVVNIVVIAWCVG